MKTFKPSLLSAAVATAFTMSAASYAQEAQQQQPSSEDVEVIAVSGVRVSILSALDAKRNSDVVGDFVGGGDLGVLPDPSIADALGRIPGVTTVRDNGQSSQLNIRGMNGDFIQTTLNGREQASTSGYTESTRWMAFDQYPAELITEAAVYKSPKASHIEGGVAGLVELKTVNPLRAEKEHNFNASFRASYNDGASDVGADEFGERFTLSYTGKFMDEKLGLALGFSHLDQPNSFTKARAGADSQIGYGPTDAQGNNRAAAFQWQAGTGSDKRNGYLASLVYQPNESFKAQLDYFKSKFDRKDVRHGITVGGLGNANTFDLSNVTAANGVVTGATVSLTDPKTTFDSSPWFEARSEDQSTVADTDSYGLNLEWKIDDTQQLTVDIARSEGTKTRKDRLVTMHAYDLTYAGNDLVAWEEAAGQSFTYQSNGEEIPTASFSGVNFTDLDTMRMSRYEEYPHLYTDEVTSYKVDYKKYVELGPITSFEVGARISEREFNSDRGTFLYGARDGQFNGYCADNLSDIDCMPQDLDGFVSVESVTGAPDHFVVTDFDGLASSIFGAGNYAGKKVFSRDWTFVESGLLTEKVDAYYLMANLDTQWGDVAVTGNIGVRYVKTDVKSSGVQNVGAGNGSSITDDVGVTQDNYDYVSYGPEYSDTLPSLNLNFQLTDNDVVRFAAAKVMGRPPVGQLKGGAGSWNDQNANGETQYNVWTKGSPYLDPFRATQLDLSYEHYFEDGGAVSAAVFWKDIESLVEKQFFDPSQTGQAFFDNLGIEIPAGQVAGAFETFVNNDKGGYIRGFELAGTTTFTDLPGIFAGLGITASYSYTESETEISGGNLFGQNLPLPGLSKNVWSTTAFWDIGSFSTHINVRYRDEFILNMPIPGSSTPVEAQDYLTMDAQASYAFGNGLEVVMSVSNLTDEPNVIAYDQPGVLGEFTEFGRQYYLGFNYKY
ncbi:TonB-dependent receptor [Bowmanella denitrificans]|uniref:TonB-dependent receptor n=1 Tax=Bowmanella denitrificans TaxID=366582 RepID=A0ABN0XDL6_9ALTE